MILPGIGTAIGGVIGAIGGLFGNSYADNMADASAAQLAQAERDRQQALGFAAPTQDELANLQSMIANAERYYSLQQAEVQRNQEFITKAYGPNILAAGQNAYNLLDGQQASILKPMQDQITRQRSQLVNSLRDQLGPDYQNSSAGVDALSRFDENANMTLQQAQEQAIGVATSAMGISSQSYLATLQSQSQSFTNLASMLGMVGATRNAIQARQVNALTGTPVTPYTGGDAAAAAMHDQQMAGGVSNLINAGAAYGSQQQTLQKLMSLYGSGSPGLSVNLGGGSFGGAPQAPGLGIDYSGLNPNPGIMSLGMGGAGMSQNRFISPDVSGVPTAGYSPSYAPPMAPGGSSYGQGIMGLTGPTGFSGYPSNYGGYGGYMGNGR